MLREEAIPFILRAKQRLNLSWNDLSGVVNRSDVWVAAALFGQATMSREEAESIGSALDLSEDVWETLMTVPYRGTNLEVIPRDPTLYRFYEILMVYGNALKELIHEKFGDGIMSAIDFRVDIAKQADPHGDRVVITMDGKFLPYKKW